jgi:hypothetical protein
LPVGRYDTAGIQLLAYDGRGGKIGLSVERSERDKEQRSGCKKDAHKKTGSLGFFPGEPVVSV